MIDEIDEQELDAEEITSLALEPRKKQVKAPQSLPADFIKNIAKLFNDQFQAERAEASFSIYGGLYPEEALLCVSISEVGKLRAVSLFMSSDLMKKGIAEKPQQVTELLKSMVDLGASWFAQCFQEQKEEEGLEAILAAVEEYDRNWQKISWEKRELYVKVSRANQTLEAAADRFLRENDPDKH